MRILCSHADAAQPRLFAALAQIKTSGGPPHPDTGTERIIPGYRSEAEENLNPYSLTRGLWIPRTRPMARARNDGTKGFARTGVVGPRQSRRERRDERL